MVKRFIILFFICLLVITVQTAIIAEDPPPEEPELPPRCAQPVINSINGVTDLSDRVYFKESGTITVEGSSQYNTIVKIYVGDYGWVTYGADATDGSWSYTFTVPPGVYNIRAWAMYPEYTHLPELTSEHSQYKYFTYDNSKPSVTAYNRSYYQGNSTYVRSELNELYAMVSDTFSGFATTTTFDITVYDITADSYVPGTKYFNGSNKIWFVPTNGYSSGSFTHNHEYRISASISDRANNSSDVAINEFTVDYEAPAVMDLSVSTNWRGCYPTTNTKYYSNVFVYDPKHVPNDPELGDIGEPTFNYPLTADESNEITGDDRLSGFVRYYYGMVVGTNPNRMFFKFNHADPYDDASRPWGAWNSMKAYYCYDYIDSWNYRGGYSFSRQSSYDHDNPTSNANSGIVQSDPTKPGYGWWVTNSNVKPQGVFVNDWYYVRDYAYNRYSRSFYYFCTSGPPKAPSVYSSSLYKNGSTKILPDSIAGSDARVIQTISGQVAAAGSSQFARAYVGGGPVLGSEVYFPKTNVEGINKEFNIENTNSVKYNSNGVTTIYMISRNEEYGDGPSYHWWAAYTDNTHPVVSNAYIQGATEALPAYTSQNVPTEVRISAYDSPYASWGQSVWGIDTSISGFTVVGDPLSGDLTTFSHDETINWSRSGSSYIAYMTLGSTSREAMKAEYTYKVNPSITDLYGLGATGGLRNVFKIDNTSPQYIKLEPKQQEGEDNVSDLSKFTAFIDDGWLSGDGSTASGTKFGSGSSSIGDLDYSQLYIYKVLSKEKPSSNVSFTVHIQDEYIDTEEQVSDILLDHTGSAISTTRDVLEIWDVSMNVVQTDANLLYNDSDMIIVTTDVELISTQSYYIMYRIPFYYASDGVSKLSAIPFRPVSMIGQYRAWVYGIDNVGNMRYFPVNYQIAFDPPTGFIPFGEITGQTRVTANGSVTSSYYSFSAGPIETKSGATVKAGTRVTVVLDPDMRDIYKYTDTVERIDDLDDALSGTQFLTNDEGYVTFSICSTRVGTASIYVKTEAGTAKSNKWYIYYKPDSVSDLRFVFPGQEFLDEKSHLGITDNTTLENFILVSGNAYVPTAGVTYDLKIYPVDFFGHNIEDLDHTIKLSSNESHAQIWGPYKEDSTYGVYFRFRVREEIAGTHRIYTVQDQTKPVVNNSITTTVNPAAAAKIVALLDGEILDCNESDGRSGTVSTYEVGESINVTAWITDEFYNLVPDATASLILDPSNQHAWCNPTENTISDLDRSFSVIESLPGEGRSILVEDNAGILDSDNTSEYRINTGPATQMKVLLPGQQIAPLIGVTGEPDDIEAGDPFMVTVYAVDDRYNLDAINSNGRVIELTIPTEGLDIDVEPVIDNQYRTLIDSGIATFQVTEYVAIDDRTLDIYDRSFGAGITAFSPTSSATYNVLIDSGGADRLLLLLPGEEYKPGYGNGRTADSQPDTQVRYVPFTATIFSTDRYYNKVDSDANVYFSGIDDFYTTIVPRAVSSGTSRQLSEGTVTFSVTEEFEWTTNRKTLTIASDTLAGMTSSEYSVVKDLSSPVRLSLLLPGQTFIPGASKQGSAQMGTAGTPFIVTVNVLNSAREITTADAYITLDGPTTCNPVSRYTGDSDTVTFSVTHETATAWYSGDTLQENKTYIEAITPLLTRDRVEYTVTANTPHQLLLVLPGQDYVRNAGVTGVPARQMVDNGFNIEAYVVDQYYNQADCGYTITLNSSETQYSIVTPSVDLLHGYKQFSITENLVGDDRELRAGIASLGFETVSTFDVKAGAIEGINILYPDMMYMPGTLSGASGTAVIKTAGQEFVITVNVTDKMNNLITDYQGSVELTVINNTCDITGPTVFTNGIATYNVIAYKADESTFKADSVLGLNTYTTTCDVTIAYGDAAGIQILLPGESLVPGIKEGAGKTGTIDTVKVGVPFSINVSVVDAYNNLVNNASASQWSITLNSSADYSADSSGAISPPWRGTPSYGNAEFSIREIVAGEIKYTASANGNIISASMTIIPDDPWGLLALIPGERHVPGYITHSNVDLRGKMGTPNVQKAGVDFPVTVNMVDQYFNRISAINHYIKIGSTDPSRGTELYKYMNDGQAVFSAREYTMTEPSTNRILRAYDVTHYLNQWTPPDGFTRGVDPGLPGFQVEHGMPATISVTAVQAITANGVATSSIVLLVRDSERNPVDDQYITITTNMAYDTITVVSANTNGNGYAYFAIASIKAGDRLVSIQSVDPEGNGTLNTTCLVSFVGDNDNPSVTLSYMTKTKRNIIPGSEDNVLITVRMLDVNSNAISGLEVGVSTNRGISDNITTINSITNSNGDAFYRISSSYLGDAVVFARNLTHGKDLLTSANIYFAADRDHPSTSNSLLWRTAGGDYQAQNGVWEIVADDDIKVEVSLKDSWNNLITGNQVAIYTGRPSDDIVTDIRNIATSELPTARFKMTSVKSGTGNIYAKDIGSGYVLDTIIKYEYVPAAFDPASSNIVVTPNPLDADGESTASIRVFVCDRFGNPRSGETVYLYTTRPTNDVIVTLNSVTDEEGFANYILSTIKLGTGTFSANIAGKGYIDVPANVNYIPGKVSTENSIIVLSDDTTTVTETDYIQFDLILKDKVNNLLEGVTLSVAAGRGDVDIVRPSSILRSDVNGVVSFNVSSRQIGTTTLSITEIIHDIIITENIGLEFIIDNSLISATQSVFTLSPGTITVSNTITSTASVTLKDFFGNRISGNSVTLYTEGVTVSVVPASVTSDVNGMAVFGVKGQFAGQVTIYAIDQRNNVTLNQTQSLTLIPDRLSISPEYSYTEVLPPFAGQDYRESYANGKSYAQVKAVVKDVFGNLVDDKKLAVSSSRGSTDVVVILNASDISGYDGVNNGESRFYIKSTKVGRPVIKGYDVETGVTFNNTVMLNFVADRFNPSLSLSSLHMTPLTCYANGTENITVTLYLMDPLNNAISGNRITIASSRGATDTITPNASTTNALGVARLYITSRLYGNPKITVTDETSRQTLFADQQLEFIAEPIPSVINSVVESTYETILVQQRMGLQVVQNETEIKVALRDANNNPIVNNTVTVTSNRADDVFQPYSADTDTNGRVTFLLRSRYSGTSIVSAYHDISGELVGKTTVVFANPAADSVMKVYKDPDNLQETDTFKLNADKIYIELNDGNQNEDSFGINTVNVTLKNPIFGDQETATLEETAVNSGLFNNFNSGVTTSFTESAAVVSNNVLEGTYRNSISIEYTDPDYPEDTSVINVRLDITEMVLEREHAAYLSQAKDKVVFRYNLSETGDIEIWIYNLAGELVWRKNMTSGSEGTKTTEQNIVEWDLNDAFGNQIKNGAYIYRILRSRGGSYDPIYRGKMLVVK
ncbi:Ig-like domain-containing protein [Candidatus Margulisiibacteriota bacterium]